MALSAERIKQAEFVRNVFAITPEVNTTLKQMLEPSFWAHVAAKLHPTDRIEVTAEDGTFFAELFVVSCARNWAKVCLLRFVELSEDVAKEENTAAEYFVDWGGPIAKARIIRAVDKEVIKDGYASKAIAEKALVEFEKSLLL